jgi:hypothetical protein
MATHPANEYDDNGVLTRRAIASDVAGPAEEAQAVTGRPNDTAPENSTFAERAQARTKQVTDAENKAVSAKKSSKK